MSTKGQIVVPGKIRECAGIEAGDKLEILLEGDRIQITKAGEPRRRRLKIKINEPSGMPYFDVPKDAPSITDEWVEHQKANFLDPVARFNVQLTLA